MANRERTSRARVLERRGLAPEHERRRLRLDDGRQRRRPRYRDGRGADGERADAARKGQRLLLGGHRLVVVLPDVRAGGGQLLCR